jgi:hypothetical protein
MRVLLDQRRDPRGDQLEWIGHAFTLATECDSFRPESVANKEQSYPQAPHENVVIHRFGEALDGLGEHVAMAAGRSSEADIDEGLVVRLLDEQAPQLDGLPVRHVTDGWEDAIWRLGDDLAIRITRREVAVNPHLHEVHELGRHHLYRVVAEQRPGSWRA